MSKNNEVTILDAFLLFKKGYTLKFVKSTLEEKQLKGLKVFSNLKSEKISDLDFLKDYVFLEALDISSTDDYNFDFLSSLSNLKDLSISTEGGNKINLSNQVNLKKLTLQWRLGKIFGIEKCQNIDSLCLIDFKEDDFTRIAQLNKLRALQIKTSSVKTLEGLHKFSALETLSLGNCKRLKTIKDMANVKSLKYLNIEFCPNIKDYSSIGELSKLEALEITDCKNINTIQFIQNLGMLEKLTLLGSTNVVDGNMIPAKSIKEVIYKPRPHYNIRIENSTNAALQTNNLKKIKQIFK
jgi:hypothetical protein